MNFDQTLSETTLKRAYSLKNWNHNTFWAHLIIFMTFLVAFVVTLSDEGENALKGIRTSSYVTVPVFQRRLKNESGIFTSFSSDVSSPDAEYGTDGQRNVTQRGIEAIERVPNNNLVLPFLILGFSLITAIFHFVNFWELRQKLQQLDKKKQIPEQKTELEDSVNEKEEQGNEKKEENQSPRGSREVVTELGTYGNSVLKKACNYRRWLEYAITATVMVIIVALSFGLREFYALLLIACIIPVVMYMGHLVEKAMNRWAQASSEKASKGSSDSPEEAKRDAWIATGFGWALLFVIFGILLTSLLDTLKTLDEFRDTLKEMGDEETLSDFNDFKGLIIASCCIIIVFYITFGVVQVVDLIRSTPIRSPWNKKGTEEDKMKVLKYLQDQEKRGYINEKSYCILSFVSKISLIVLLGWGLFGRSRENTESTSEEESKCDQQQ